MCDWRNINLKKVDFNESYYEVVKRVKGIKIFSTPGVGPYEGRDVIFMDRFSPACLRAKFGEIKRFLSNICEEIEGPLFLEGMNAHGWLADEKAKKRLIEAVL